jgi:uncharacterized Tic20 family protein
MSDSAAAAPMLPHTPPFAGAAPPPPHGAAPSSSERSYAVVIHLSTFFAPLLGPLVLWLLQKDESRFADHHGREALNFHITQLLIGFVLTLFCVCTLGIGIVVTLPLAFALAVLDLVATIFAAIRAHEGVLWRYPLTLRLI